MKLTENDKLRWGVGFDGMVKGDNGYNTNSYRHYDVQRWFREVHQLDVIVTPILTGNGRRYTADIYNKDVTMDSCTGIWETYEQALEEGLEEALKLI